MTIPAIQMTRRVVFSSGHRYWDALRSPEENLAIYGQWASRFNHGHNYALEVTVEGRVDDRTGMVVNIKRIDDLLKDQVLSNCDGRSLNDEVAFFSERTPTTENILFYCWNQILPVLPQECNLTHLKLEETPTLYGELTTKNMTLTRTYEFAASHRLHSDALSDQENIDLFGKCNNLAGHGHNYILEVTVQGEPDQRSGMMVDLGALDKVVNEEVVDRYDHKNLSVDLPEFMGRPASSENIVAEIFSRLKPTLPAKLHRVRLFETARNFFAIEAED